MASYALDVERFISEVKKHPELWDASSDDFRIRSRKNRAWGEVAKIFIDNFEDMSKEDKSEVYKKLYSKWRNIRDSYVRRRKKHHGKSNYLYSKQLAFINEFYKLNSDSDEDNNEDNEDAWSYNHATNDSEWPVDETEIKRKKRKSDIEFVEADFSEALGSAAVPDEDKSFFDSLLPAVREFSIDQKLEFRSDVLKLIKMYRKTSMVTVHLKEELIN